MKALLTPDRYRVTAWALGVIALMSPILLIAQFQAGEDPDILAVVLWLAIPNATAGFVLSWRWISLPDPLATVGSKAYQRWSRAADRGLVDAVIVLLIQFVGVVVIQLGVAISENDWDEFFIGPLLITACAGMALFLAILLGLLVVGPIRTLLGALITKLSGGRVDSARPAFGLLLLLLIPIAVLSQLAGYSAPDTTGAGTGAKGAIGLLYLVQVMFTVQGTVEQQLFAWATRLLIILLALDLVWLVRIARRRKAAES